MPQLHEFTSHSSAKERHADLRRLGWRPFSIFQTARGTWAFWTN